MIDDLDRWLYLLESRAPLLDDLLIPRSGGGQSTGKPPARRASKPPLVVDIADLKSRVEDTLGFWCGRVVAASEVGVPAPAVRDASVRARWLARHLDVIRRQAWAEMMAEEIAGLAAVVVEVVEPAGEEVEPPAFGTARQMQRWARHCGCDVSRTKIQRWVLTGELATETTPDGRQLVRLADVLALARR